MEVNIFALYNNRPDFIELQLNSLKHLKDKFIFYVVNNPYYEFDKSTEIELECQRLGVKMLRLDHHYKKGDKIKDVSTLVKESLNFLWQNKLKDLKGIVAIMDCDLFFTQDVSFNAIMEGYDMAFCPIYTEGKVWPWTGLMLFNMGTIKAEDVSFGFAPLDQKFYQDVGSAINNYVVKYNPKIHFFNRREILNYDWPVKGSETLHTLGFPKPYSVDLVEDWLFHYKTSSNYAKHCTKKYNKLKTKALCKLLTS